jgi:hypothetical protein
VARYIRDNVVESKQNGYFNQWSKNALRAQAHSIRRTRATHICVGPSLHNRENTSISRNSRNARMTNREKFSIRIPNTTTEALRLDKENNNLLWAEAIDKEMSALERLECFKFVDPTTTFSRSDGWQFAPMRMIFDVKQEDMRHKARFFMGGHVVDSSQHTTYSSTISDLSVCLLMLIAVQNQLSLMVGDVGNAFPTAPCAEKIWSIAGPEF